MDYGRRNKIAFRIQVEKGNSETGIPRFKALEMREMLVDISSTFLNVNIIMTTV